MIRTSMSLSSVIRVVLVAGMLLFAADGWGARIADSRHNLSTTGPGPIKSDTEGEICIFCHTPHRARLDVTYLWNRAASAATYITYTSSTLRAGEIDEGVGQRRVGQPTGASAMCLSCHDGTIALGATLSRRQEISFPVQYRFMPETSSGLLGTDISDDHPVSFKYDSALATASGGELVQPANLPSAVRLDGLEMLQCTACHDPHNNEHGKFLVMGNSYSALCISCHSPADWEASSHEASTATWNATGDDPWPHTAFDTVAENACANCHRPHKAAGHERLLSDPIEANVCLVCHTGNVASADIGAETLKVYGHFVQDYGGVHDPAEDFAEAVNNHVECVDCHNPHRVDSSAPLEPGGVPGSMRGVKGLDASGNTVVSADFTYEICIKCHSGLNQFEPGTYTINRQDAQPDLLLALGVANPSYHPVMGAVKNMDVPSLIAPLTENSIITCTDCHGNDDSGGPKGPHGSSHRYLLVENYTTGDNTVESNLEYALCYACHDRTSILNTGNPSGFPHKTHIVDYQAPCSACHDPHGSTVNTHLINFDLGIVGPYDPLGVNLLAFVDNGSNAGSCTLVCHGSSHDGTALYSYP